MRSDPEGARLGAAGEGAIVYRFGRAISTYDKASRATWVRPETAARLHHTPAKNSRDRALPGRDLAIRPTVNPITKLGVSCASALQTAVAGEVIRQHVQLSWPQPPRQGAVDRWQPHPDNPPVEDHILVQNREWTAGSGAARGAKLFRC